jgi:hypothetical protein
MLQAQSAERPRVADRAALRPVGVAAAMPEPARRSAERVASAALPPGEREVSDAAAAPRQEGAVPVGVAARLQAVPAAVAVLQRVVPAAVAVPQQAAPVGAAVLRQAAPGAVAVQQPAVQAEAERLRAVPGAGVALPWAVALAFRRDRVRPPVP